jgi:hypothetical protein
MIDVCTLPITSAFWLADGLPEHWSLSIFKAVEPLFNLSDPHCIIVETLLNFVDCFHFGILRFLAKLDAVSLL